MKKLLSRILFYIMLLTACFGALQAASAADIEFNTDGNFEIFSYGNNISEPVIKDGMLSFTTTSTDPQLYFLSNYDISAKTGGVTNADKAKKIEIRFASTVASGQLEVFFTSINPEDGSYYCKPYSSSDTSEQSYVKNASYIPYSGTGSLDKFTTLTVDMTSKTYWKGIVNHLRIDPGKISDADFLIDYIRFIGDDEEDDETTVKTEIILEEEKLYGECLFFDDFESYNAGDVPENVFYSKLGTTSLKKADACGEIKIVDGIGTNTTKVIELTGNNANSKYPFIKVFYALDKKGQYTMLADMYSAPVGNFYMCHFNGYSGTGSQPDKRIMVNRAGTKSTWTAVSSSYDTGTIDGFTNMTYFGFGANGVSVGEKLYIDNIRVYFKESYEAQVLSGGGEGTAPVVRFAPNGKITFPENTFTREGYTFTGWKTSVNNNLYIPGSTMNVGDITSLTITAAWKRTVTPEKTQQILEEEKLYGECLFFDDFENYVVGEVPLNVYYSKLGETTIKKADQCGEIKIASGIGDNKTQVLELVGNGTTYKYPFVRVAYKLEDHGKYTMLADMYTEYPATAWSFFNGYSGTGGQSDKRIMYNATVYPANWQKVSTEYFTTDITGLTSVNYFGFGATNISNGQTVYVDNIRVYYKESYEADFVCGDGAQGTSPVLKFSENDTVILPKNTFTKEGYVFAGWKSSLNGRVYQEGEKLALGNTNKLTLTATWARFVPKAVRKNSIRTQGIQGIRFAGYVANEDKPYADQIGFIATTADLLGENELKFGVTGENGVGVSPDGVKYVYGAAYDAATGKDIIYTNDGNVFGSPVWEDVQGTFFTGVLTHIPEWEYLTKFVVRPYALIDGEYVYGETIVKSVSDIAISMYNEGVRDEYVLNIIEKTGVTPKRTVCFLGDSITHDGKFIRELAQLYLESDDLGRYEFYNCGISGDTAAGGIRRLDSDLLTYNPDIVIMMFGMNDIGRNNYVKGNYSEEIEAKRKASLDNYKNNMTTIIDRLLDEGIEVILCTPTPFDDVSVTNNESNIGLAACAEFVRQTAKERGLALVDHYANMYNLRSTKYWGSDGVHPNVLGQHVMAQSIMYSLGYIDEMDVTTPISVFDEINEARHTASYDYRMVLMVDYTLINSGYITIDAKKNRAAELIISNPSWRGIYQQYIDNIENVDYMKEEVIRLTEEMCYKD